MNSSNLYKLVRPVVVILFLAAVGDASARPPRAREWCGVVERIDPDARTLTIKSAETGRTLKALLRDRTQFVHNSQFDSLSALKPGTHACVYYRSPLFGKPFVTKVVWANSKTSNSQEHEL